MKEFCIVKKIRWGRIVILLAIICSVVAGWFFFQERVLEKKEVTKAEEKIEKEKVVKEQKKEEPVPQIPEPIMEAKAAVIIDASNGKMVYKHNEAEALAPASMSKMMTAYLVLENVKKGNIHWEDQVQMSAKAAYTVGASIPVQPGSTLTVKDLYYALMLQSANNAAVALAEHIAGTEEEFVVLMNEKAKQLKLTEATVFVNASGLQNPDGTETKMAAADVGTLTYRLAKDYPEILEVTKLTESQLAFQNIVVKNTNKMLNTANSDVYFEGMDGMKTGFTDSAGYCFAGTAVQGKERLITVVMGTDSEYKRFTETHKLLTYGFQIVK